MRASVQGLRDFLGGASLPDTRLEAVLEPARRKVISDGVPEEHEAFGDLQLLFCCVMLEAAGAISGNIASRSVGDVSVSFGSGGAAGESFQSIYRRLLLSTAGFKGRIV